MYVGSMNNNCKQIAHLSYSLTSGSWVVVNALLADYASQAGDSGGLVVVHLDVPHVGFVVGIHLGATYTLGPRRTIISRVSAINTNLGTSLR